MKTIFSDRYKQILETLVHARHECNFTQSELAAQLNKPQSYVSKYEHGERRVDVIELIEICRALQISATDLVEDIERDFKNAQDKT